MNYVLNLCTDSFIRRRHLTKRGFVLLLGYSDVEAGLREFEHFMLTGEMTAFLWRQLRRLLSLPPGEFEDLNYLHHQQMRAAGAPDGPPCARTPSPARTPPPACRASRFLALTA